MEIKVPMKVQGNNINIIPIQGLGLKRRKKDSS